MKINITFKKQGVGKDETPTYNDLLLAQREALRQYYKLLYSKESHRFMVTHEPTLGA